LADSVDRLAALRSEPKRDRVEDQDESEPSDDSEDEVDDAADETDHDGRRWYHLRGAGTDGGLGSSVSYADSRWVLLEADGREGSPEGTPPVWSPRSPSEMTRRCRWLGPSSTANARELRAESPTCPAWSRRPTWAAQGGADSPKPGGERRWVPEWRGKGRRAGEEGGP
jgi:hypothetical protein